MVEPLGWGKSRSLILIAVLALHVATVALLVWSTRTRTMIPATERPLEVMLLPPKPVPRVRADSLKRERLSTNIAMASAPPRFDSSAQTSAGAAPNGHGAAVNWAAEAHRALRAFEIRRDQLPSSARSVSPPPDEWWQLEHHVGDQFKTDSGDWIVWVSANCYQVASWHGTAALDSNLGNPVCRSPGAMKHDD